MAVTCGRWTSISTALSGVTSNDAAPLRRPSALLRTPAPRGERDPLTCAAFHRPGQNTGGERLRHVQPVAASGVLIIGGVQVRHRVRRRASKDFGNGLLA